MALRDTLEKLVSSDKYRDARARTDSWHASIIGGAESDVGRALREKNKYFAAMRKKDPGLYSLFESDDRALSAAGIKRMSGREIIID